MLLRELEKEGRGWMDLLESKMPKKERINWKKITKKVDEDIEKRNL